MAIVMVVDDSEIDLRLSARLLERGNYQVEFARNGREALKKLQHISPDLILTDLQMPELDGLELVRAIRLHFSAVPVVLMTAHGSDELAIQALELGASGYVPKGHLNDRLLSTVAEVLAVSRADRSYSRLIGCLHRTEFDFCLENDPQLIEPLVDLIQQIVSGMGLCDTTGRLRIGMAVQSALMNALYRGNLEITAEDQMHEEAQCKFDEFVAQRVADSRFASRRIHAHIIIRRTEAEFRIRDEGPGFDHAKLFDCDQKANLVSNTGRGLVLMRTFMDKVQFNEHGNEVVMLKLRDADST